LFTITIYTNYIKLVWRKILGGEEKKGATLKSHLMAWGSSFLIEEFLYKVCVRK